MKLVEDKKLSLDTSIADFIENSPTAWQEIRIRNLLTHTSGLPEVQANPKYACLGEDKKKGLTAEEEIAYLKELPLKFKPGEKWAYHISGYHLLSYIIEKLSGQSYERFLQTRVFEPLEMKSTRFGSTEMAVIKGRSTTSYSRMTGELTGWIYPFSKRDFPASALNSSVPDLARLLVALDKGVVLKDVNRDQLWTATKLNDGSTKDYGLGWALAEHKGRKVVGHEGGGAIWVAHFPEVHLSVIVLCNLNGARADEIQYGVADLYLN
jgi:CubicO group peptidase (beta-lactamase class C family)